MENHIDHPLTVTVDEAAKLLGIGRSTAYELVHTGDIPSLRLGRRIVVPVAQIAAQLGLSYDAVWTLMDHDCQPSAVVVEKTASRPMASAVPSPTAPSEVPMLF